MRTFLLIVLNLALLASFSSQSATNDPSIEVNWTKPGPNIRSNQNTSHRSNAHHNSRVGAWKYRNSVEIGLTATGVRKGPGLNIEIQITAFDAKTPLPDSLFLYELNSGEYWILNGPTYRTNGMIKLNIPNFHGREVASLILVAKSTRNRFGIGKLQLRYSKRSEVSSKVVKDYRSFSEFKFREILSKKTAKIDLNNKHEGFYNPYSKTLIDQPYINLSSREKLLLLLDMPPSSSLIVNENVKSSVEFGTLTPILAGNGKIVEDALHFERAEDKERWKIEPFTIIRINGNGIQGDSLYLETEFEGKQSKSITIYKKQENSQAYTPPFVSAWAYTDDPAFKQNLDDYTQDLNGLARNVVFIHRRNLPIPSINSFNAKQLSKLESNIQVASNSDFILLNLGWKAVQVSGGVLANLGDEKKKEVIGAWIVNILEVMKKNGISNDRWALYPIDEPNNAQHVHIIKLLGKIIEDKQLEIRIFANPGRHFKEEHFDQIHRYVQIWQPNIELLKKRQLNFFGNEKNYWLYSVPSYPAKAESPTMYQDLAWHAWAIGVQGLGFWSVGHTSGQSVWNDFDGDQPDGSALYELKSRKRFTSMRWEAFLQGLRDYKLISTSSGNGRCGNWLRKTKILVRDSLTNNTGFNSHEQSQNLRYKCL